MTRGGKKGRQHLVDDGKPEAASELLIFLETFFFLDKHQEKFMVEKFLIFFLSFRLFNFLAL